MPKGLLVPFFREIQSRPIRLIRRTVWFRVGILCLSLVLVPILLYHAIEKPMILLGIRLVARLRDKEPEAMAVTA